VSSIYGAAAFKRKQWLYIAGPQVRIDPHDLEMGITDEFRLSKLKSEFFKLKIDNENIICL
jgi:hypothetical protein